MQKKIILFILSLILITGCSLAPFNTKAKLSYSVLTNLDYNLDEGKEDEFIVTLSILSENSVSADISEVGVEINGIARTAYVINRKINGDATNNIQILPFVDKNETNVYTAESENKLVIKYIKAKDSNENTIDLGEMSQKLTVKRIDESSSITVVKASNLESEIIYNGDLLESINLTWTDNNSGIDANYEVYRKKEGETYSKINTSTLEVTSYIDSDLTALSEGNKYYYYVVIVDSVSGKQSEISTVSTTKVSKVGNYKVSNLISSAIENTKFVKLNWDAIQSSTDLNTAAIKGYKISRKDNKSIYAEVADIKTPTTIEWIDSDNNLKEKTTYTYKVEVYDELGKKGLAVESIVTTGDISSPSEPTTLNASLLPDFKIKLTWTAGTDKDIKEYKVFAGIDSQNLGEGVSTGIETSYIYDAISTDKNKIIYFKVQAYDEAGNASELSYLTSKKIDYTSIIKEAQNIVILTDGINVELSWEEPVKVTGYIIKEYKVTWEWEEELEGVVTTKTGERTGIKATTLKLAVPSDINYGEYKFKVMAIGENGEEGVESIGSYQLVLKPGNYAVTDLTATNVLGTESIELKWTALSDSVVENTAKIKSYEIYRKNNTSGLFEKIADKEGKEANTYIDDADSLSQKTEYTYKILVIDELGKAGAENLALAEIADMTNPTSPSTLTASLEAGWKIKLNWIVSEKDTDVKGYYIYKSTNGEFGEVSVNENPVILNNYTYTLSNAEIIASQAIDSTVKDFYFTVKAIDTAGNKSEKSNISSVSVDYSEKIKAPGNVSITGAPESATMKWDKVVVDGYDIIGYKVSYGKDISLGSDVYTTSNNTKIVNLDAGVVYFRVSAYGKGDGTTEGREFGKESSLLSANIYANIASLTAQDVQLDIGETGIIVKWKNSLEENHTNISGYVVYRATGKEEEEDLSIDEYTMVKYSKKLPVTEFGFEPPSDSNNDGWYVFEDKGANDIGTKYFYKIAAYKETLENDGYKYPGTFSPETAIQNFGAPNEVTYDNLKVNSYAPYDFMRVSWGGYVFNDIDIAGFKVYISRTPTGQEYLIGQTSLAYLDISTEKNGNYDKFKAESIIERDVEGWLQKGTLSSNYLTGVTDIVINDYVSEFIAGDYVKIDTDYYEIETAGATMKLKTGLAKDYNSGDAIYVYNKQSGIDLEKSEVELYDPTTNKDRIVYVKVAAINKAGIESPRTAYKWVDLVAPNQRNLNVGVETKTKDGTVSATINWLPLADASSYHVYRYKQATINDTNIDLKGSPYSGAVYLGEVTTNSYTESKLEEIQGYVSGVTEWVYAVVAEDGYGNRSVLTKDGVALDGTNLNSGDGFKSVILP